MKNFLVCVLVVGVMMLGFCKNCSAGAATPMEVMDKVQAAVKLIGDEGLDAALPKIRDKNGPFVWKDSYVVVSHMDGTWLVHPYSPDMEGKNQLGTKDAKGKLFEVEMREVIKDTGSGWVDYYWTKPNKLTPSYKVTYVLKVPGKDVLCYAGIYDLRKEDVMTLLKMMGKK